MSEKKEKTKKSAERSPASKAVFALILTLAIGVFLISGLKLLSILTQYKEGQDTYKRISQTVVKDEPQADYPTIDFNALRGINPQIAGYIYIKDFMEYPIVQGTDNDTYLRTMLDGTYNPCGTLFVDCNIPEGMEAQNVIIYGHNMDDGSMFGQLHKYFEPDFFAANRTVHIYTPEHHYLYKVVAAYTASVDGFTYQYSFTDEADYMKFLTETKNASVIPVDTELNAESRVITLSTCTADGSDYYRDVVILVRDGEITE